MEASNHFCDTPNCRYPAEKFVISSFAKMRACHAHLSNLIAKRLTIYDIEAFNFIQSAADLPLYEARRKETEMGIGNLTVLDAACDIELREALEALEKAKLKAVQVIEAAFELSKIKTQRKYQETKDSLQAMKNSFEHYQVFQDAKLSPAEQILTQDSGCQLRLLRSVVTDTSLELAQIAVNSWKCSEQTIQDTLLLLGAEMRDKFVTDLAAKAKLSWSNGLYEVSEEERLYARSLGYLEELDQDMEIVTNNRRKKLVKLLELTLDETEVRHVASYYQEKAKSALFQGDTTLPEKESGANKEKKTSFLLAAQQYEKSIKYWTKALRLLHLRLPRDPQTARLNSEYGKFLWEQWDLKSEAVNALKESVEIEQTLSPCSEEAGKATILLIQVLICENRHSEAVDLIIRTLTRIPDYDSNSGIRILLHCDLAWIYSYTKSTEETEQILSLCTLDKCKPGSELTALSYKALGCAYFHLNRDTESETLLKSALSIYKSLAPNSQNVATIMNNLGTVFKETKRYGEANTMYRDALTHLRTNSPTSKQVAVTLTAIGELCREMKKYAEAETAYNEVLETYETYCPQSEDVPRTYHALALVFQDYTLNKRAEKHFKQAFAIYQKDFPNTDGAVSALRDFLKFYFYTKKLKPAEILRKSTIVNALTTYPNSELTAEVYNCLGSVLVDAECYKEAEQMWTSALQILQTYYPTSLKHAKMLHAFGSLNELMKKNEEAEAAYRSALTIYESYFPESKEKTDLLLKLAKMYSNLKKYGEAYEIYRVYFPNSEETGYAALALADQYPETHHFEYRESMYRKALAIFKAISPTSVNTIDTLTKLGLFYQKNQHCKDAEPVLLEALKVSRNQAPDPATLSSLLFNLGNIYYNLNRFSEAEGMYREALTISLTHFPTSGNLPGTLFNLGNLCYISGRFTEAEVEYQKALELYKAREPMSPNTALTLFSLGKVNEALSRSREAIAFIESALAIWKVSDVQKVKELAYPSLKTLYTVSKQEDKLVALAVVVSLL